LLLTLLLAMLGSLPSDLRPLMPALQSRWLHAHVATAILAYSLFAVSFCLGLIYLFQPFLDEADLKIIDRRMYQLVVWGFTLLTLVIITGAVWAEEVWGNWWSWDPKETWSLVTWVVYAAYLHSRRTIGWRGRKSAWLVVIGFLVVLFTLFGVSILLPGLHSYA
jgi:ABC-type transport system involved in cytochrome c biogenesis permease subunit